MVIAGGSCSGKSLLALIIEEELKKKGIGVSTLGLDDYYKNNDHPEFPYDSSGRLIFDLPASYLFEEFRRDIETLLSGSNAKSPIYDKKNHQRAINCRRLSKANQVIIAEGLFAIEALSGVSHKNILIIFVEADDNIRTGRRLKRDTGHLHFTEADTLQFIKERVEPYYENYVKPQMAKAGIIIINN